MARLLRLLLAWCGRPLLTAFIFFTTSFLFMISIVKYQNGLDVTLTEFILDQTGIVSLAPKRLCNRCSNFTGNLPLVSETTSKWCKVAENPILLVLVMSHPKNKVQRNTIRHTWGNVGSNPSMKVLFVIGQDPDSNYKHEMDTECSTHRDLLRVGLKEDYKHLTNKTMTALNWVVHQCNRTEYILKTDDDCYNNLELFSNYLQFEVPRLQTIDFVGGYCFTTRPSRITKSKWYIPKEDFPDVYYPMYCGGPAYVMSQNAAAKIVRVSQNVTFFYLEDVYVTGFCREAANLGYVQIPGVQAPKKFSNTCDVKNSVLNIHKLEPQEMVSLWNIKEDKNELCHTFNLSKASIAYFLVIFFCMLYIVFCRRKPS